MKKSIFFSILLTMFLSIVSKTAFAYNIVVENDYGVSIYYNYFSERELIVTYDDYYDRKYTGTIIIPNEVTYMNRTLKVIGIGEKAFNNCSSLTSVSIPSSVTTIGERAFSGCSNLTTITIPYGVITIDKFAFYNCSNLTSVTISNSVISIGDEAFFGCSKLASIVIGNSVTSIGSWAFSGCRLNSVYISDIAAWCTITFNRESNPLNFAKLYLNGEEVKELVIPNSVTTIGEYTFEGCTSLTSVIIGNNVTSIGQMAFRNCSNLISITIPNSVTSIGYNAFEGCSNLTSVTIPNSVQNIGSCAFYGCTNLKTVRISNNVTTIDLSTFSRCSSLSSIIIPNGVTSIGTSAFSKCSGLSSVTIPNSVSSIGKTAFEGCKNLAYVISQIENPFGIDYSTFDNDVFNNSILYVPVGKKDKYKVTKGWKDFVFIEEGTGPNGGETPEVQKCAKPTINYNNGKLTFKSETEGAICHYTISNDDIKEESGNEVQLGITYNINVYAAKSGYENSETSTASLCWIDSEPKTEGIENSIAQVRANAVLIQSNGNMLNIIGAPEDSMIIVYNLAGDKVGSAKSVSESTFISTSLHSGEVGIVKIGDKAVKVMIE